MFSFTISWCRCFSTECSSKIIYLKFRLTLIDRKWQLHVCMLDSITVRQIEEFVADLLLKNKKGYFILSISCIWRQMYRNQIYVKSFSNNLNYAWDFTTPILLIHQTSGLKVWLSLFISRLMICPGFSASPWNGFISCSRFWGGY